MENLILGGCSNYWESWQFYVNTTLMIFHDFSPFCSLAHLLSFHLRHLCLPLTILQCILATPRYCLLSIFWSRFHTFPCYSCYCLWMVFFTLKKSQINQDLVEDRMKNDLSHIETIARSRFEKCWGSGKFQGSFGTKGSRISPMPAGLWKKVWFTLLWIWWHLVG